MKVTTIEQLLAAANVAPQVVDVMWKSVDPPSTMGARKVPIALGLLIWIVTVDEPPIGALSVDGTAGDAANCLALALSDSVADVLLYGTVRVAVWLSATVVGVNVTVRLQVAPPNAIVAPSQLVELLNAPDGEMLLVPSVAFAVPPLLIATVPLTGWPISVTGKVGKTGPSDNDGSPIAVPVT